MNTCKLLSAALACGLCAGPADAAICAADQKPAATLLIPYFEVHLTSCGSPTQAPVTRFWVRNISNAPQLAQVTLWSNLAVPAFGFFLYLPPLAAQRVDLADVLCDGRLPSSGRAVSPNSPFDTDGINENFASCNFGTDPSLGLPVANELSPAFLFDVQSRLTGRRSPATGQCYGAALEGSSTTGDETARGYITVDDVNSCQTMLPLDPMYTALLLEHDNVYVGGYEIVDQASGSAFGGAAVAIESAAAGTFALGDLTFYAHASNFAAVDRREPLPATWVATLREGGPDADLTDVILWRGQPRRNPSNGICFGSPNPALPIAQDQILFNRFGHSAPPPVLFPGQPPVQNEPFLATQRIEARRVESSSTIDTWPGGLAYVNAAFASSFGVNGQAWMGSVQISEGGYADIATGVALGSSCEPGSTAAADVSGPTAMNLNTRHFAFRDGFER